MDFGAHGGSGAIRGERGKFHGSTPALATPCRDGKFDTLAFPAVIDGQISAGSQELAPVGATGKRPTLRHFKAVSDGVGIPILIYNPPLRSVVDISVDRMKRLYELENMSASRTHPATSAELRASALPCAERAKFGRKCFAGNFRYLPKPNSREGRFART